MVFYSLIRIFASNIETITMKRKILLAVMLTLLTVSTARAQMFAVSTEATSDLLMAPSVGFELVTGNYTSVSLNGLFCQGCLLGKDIKVSALQPEYRYYFSGRPINKWFVGVGALGALFDITWKDKVYDGYALGLGLTYGYVINLNKHWSVDIHSGFGFVYYKRKEYFMHDNYDTYYTVDGQQQANAKGYYLMPTRIGVSVTYLIR